MARALPPTCALITGAASGIGFEMAQCCASRGLRLVLVDINEEGVKRAAEEIRAAHGVTVDTFQVDLSQREAPEACLAFCDARGIEVDLLINNAGIFLFDPLVEADARRVALMSDLHVYCVTRMCMLFGARMKTARHGYILNLSSLSAWMPMPGISTYNASKSYIRSLSLALGFELRPFGVNVTAVCPGGIDTALLPIPDSIRKLGRKLHCIMPPEVLAEKAIRATLRRKKQVIPGAMNHVFKFFMAIVPDFVIAWAMRVVPIYKRFLP